MFSVSRGLEHDFRRVDASLTEDDRVAKLFLALRNSYTVSLRVPSGHHLEVRARRPPGYGYVRSVTNLAEPTKVVQETRAGYIIDTPL